MTIHEAIDQYNNTLNEVHGLTVCAGYEFTTSHALCMLDPIAYRTGFDDWADSEGIDTDELTGRWPNF